MAEGCKKESAKKPVPPLKELLEPISTMISEDDKFFFEDIWYYDTSELARNPDNEECSEYAKTFALLLYYFSPEAYNYVFTKYDTCLPPVPTLRTWYVHEGGVPGFAAETLTAIGEIAKESEEKIYCNLIVQRNFDYHCDVDFVTGEGFIGFHDIGSGFDSCDDTSNKASTALVITAAAINAPWDLPIGCFFLCGDSGEKYAVLIKIAIFLLEQKGVEVLAITLPWDGAYEGVPESLGYKAPDDKTSIKEVKFISESGKEIFILKDVRALLNYVLWLWEVTEEIKDSAGASVFFKYVYQAESIFKGRTKTKKNTSYGLNDYKFTRRIAAILQHRDEINARKFPAAEASLHFLNCVGDLIDIFNLECDDVEQEKLVTDDNKATVLKKLDAICDCMTGIKTRIDAHVDFIQFGTTVKGVKEIIRLYLETGILEDIPLHKLTSLPTEDIFALIKEGSGTKKGHNIGPLNFRKGYRKTINDLLADLD